MRLKMRFDTHCYDLLLPERSPIHWIKDHEVKRDCLALADCDRAVIFTCCNSLTSRHPFLLTGI